MSTTKITVLMSPRELLAVLDSLENSCLAMQRFAKVSESREEYRLWEFRIKEMESIVGRCRSQYQDYCQIWAANEEAKRVAAALKERSKWDDYYDQDTTQ